MSYLISNCLFFNNKVGLAFAVGNRDSEVMYDWLKHNDQSHGDRYFRDLSLSLIGIRIFKRVVSELGSGICAWHLSQRFQLGFGWPSSCCRPIWFERLLNWMALGVPAMAFLARQSTSPALSLALACFGRSALDCCVDTQMGQSMDFGLDAGRHSY